MASPSGEQRRYEMSQKQAPPPIMRLHNPKTGITIYPKMEKGPDGEWRIKDPEAVKAFLAMDLASLL